MGQNQSNSLARTQKTSISRRKPSRRFGLCYTNSDDSPCLGWSTSSKNKKANLEIISWKDHMIDELYALKILDWPQKLIEFLLENNTEEKDVAFQSELFWADYNGAIKEVHYLEKPLLRGTAFKSGSMRQSHPEENFPWLEEGSSYDDSKVDLNESKQIFGKESNRELNQDIRKMLETSAILDERAYEMADNMNWMKKSYNLKAFETIKSRSTSIDQRKPTNEYGDFRMSQRNIGERMYQSSRLSHAFEECKKDIASELSSFRPTPSTNPIEVFENNTFIIQQKKNLKTRGEGRLSKFSKAVPAGSGRPSRQNGERELTGEEKLYNAVKNYKTITSIIDNHLKQEGNVFYHLLDIFGYEFRKIYGDVKQKVEAQELLLDHAKGFIEKATRDLQQFLRILYEGINLFYKLDRLKVGRKTDLGTLFNRDNMLNFITSAVFNTKIYETVFPLYQLRNLTIEETYQQALKRLYNLSPTEFGIAEEYCLDEKTAVFLKAQNLLPDFVLQLGNKSLVGSCFDGQEESKQDIALRKNTEENKGVVLPPRAQGKPYEKAILMLKSLEQRRSPIHKIKTIVRVAELLINSIEEFYSCFGVTYNQKLDADQTLVIFLYIVVKSELKDLITHCDIIQNFSTSSILDSVSGYYATTLEACVSYICSFKCEKAVRDGNEEIDIGEGGCVVSAEN